MSWGKTDEQAIVALADVSYELEGGKVDAIRWRIAAIRSIAAR